MGEQSQVTGARKKLKTAYSCNEGMHTISTTISSVLSGATTTLATINSSLLFADTRKINCLYMPRMVYALAGPVVSLTFYIGN